METHELRSGSALEVGLTSWLESLDSFLDPNGLDSIHVPATVERRGKIAGMKGGFRGRGIFRTEPDLGKIVSIDTSSWRDIYGDICRKSGDAGPS